MHIYSYSSIRYYTLRNAERSHFRCRGKMGDPAYISQVATRKSLAKIRSLYIRVNCLKTLLSLNIERSFNFPAHLHGCSQIHKYRLFDSREDARVYYMCTHTAYPAHIRRYIYVYACILRADIAFEGRHTNELFSFA